MNLAKLAALRIEEGIRPKPGAENVPTGATMYAVYVVHEKFISEHFRSV